MKKQQWKVVVALVIGLLVVGQVVWIGHVRAVGSDLARAAVEIQACHDALAKANLAHQDMVTQLKRLRSKGDLTPPEKELLSVEEQSAAVQGGLLAADAHALAAVELMEKHFNK